MRVVLIGTGARPIPPPGYGGIERTLADLSRALNQAGVRVEVLNEVYPGRTAEHRFARTLLRHRKMLEGAVVHASTPVVASRLRRMGVPYVYTTHSRHWFVVAGFTQRIGLRLEERAVKGARFAIALTPEVRARILRTFPPAQPPAHLETIGLGVDLDRFSPRAPSGDPQLALGVGALLPLKRWDWAARALQGTGIRLRLVGPPSDPEYARVLAGLPGVELAGEVSEDRLRDELQGAGMLLHPSAAELFPGVVAQAMASGRPVVGLSPIASLVDDGVTGYVPTVDASNAEAAVAALRQAVVRLSGDATLRENMGRAGREKAVRAFDWKEIAQAHLRLYDQVDREVAGAAGSSPNSASARA